MRRGIAATHVVGRRGEVAHVLEFELVRSHSTEVSLPVAREHVLRRRQPAMLPFALLLPHRYARMGVACAASTVDATVDHSYFSPGCIHNRALDERRSRESVAQIR